MKELLLFSVISLVRFSSPKRFALTGVLVCGGVVLLLLLFVAVGTMELSTKQGGDVAELPTKTDRSSGGLAQAGTEERAAKVRHVSNQFGEDGLGSELTASKSERDSEATKEVIKQANAKAAGKKKSESNLARLRRRLLEQAGHLALHGEDPAKNLVLVAQTYCRSGDQVAAFKWFEKATRMATDPDNTTNSSIALRDVVKGLLGVGELEWAESLVEQIPLEKYRDLGRAEVATALARKKRFAEAKQIASSLVDPGAHALALRGVADAQARYGELNDAVNTVMQIAPGKLQDDAWVRVALARAAVGDAAGAAGILNRISNDRTRDLAGIKVAEAQARSGKSGSLEILLSAMHDPFLRDETLRRIVQAQVSMFKFDEAKAMTYQITNEVERSLAMESLVSLQVRSGDLAGALGRARDIVVDESQSRALQVVALGMTGKEGTASGLYVAQLIENQKDRDLTYRRVAERSASLGWSKDALDTVYRIDAPEVRASALAELARWRARYGAVSPARLLLQDAMREVEQIPAQKNQEKALGFLAMAYAEADDHTSALSTAASIGNSAMRDRAYQQLTRKFATVANLNLAEQTAQAIDKEKTREQALDSMATSIAGKIPPGQALGFVNRFESRRQQVRFLVVVAGRI